MVRYFNLLASPLRYGWQVFPLDKPVPIRSAPCRRLRVHHLCGTCRQLLVRALPIDPTSTQYSPHDPRILIRHRYRGRFHPRRSSNPRIHWLRLSVFVLAQRSVARAPWISSLRR